MFPLRNIAPVEGPALVKKATIRPKAPAPAPAPAAGAPEIPAKDQGLFKTIGIKGSLTVSTIEGYLSGLNGEDALRVVNILLSRKMAAVDSLTEPVKQVVYKFIPVLIGKLTDRQRLDILPILPILSIRHSTSNPDDEDKRDEVLYNMFIQYVHQANRKPLVVMNEMLSTLKIKKLPLLDRLRTVLGRYLEGFDEDILANLSLQELYGIADDLDSSEESVSIKEYFAMEFMESFYLPGLPMILLISDYKGKLEIPGVNAPLSAKNLILFFEEYADLNAAN
jgi:hypothetical protein